MKVKIHKKKEAANFKFPAETLLQLTGTICQPR